MNTRASRPTNPKINYGPLWQYAMGRGLSYNELCKVVHAALAMAGAVEQQAATQGEPTDAMVQAYLDAQRAAVEEADRFGRPNVGGLHTNTVREACRAGLRAALGAGTEAAPTWQPIETANKHGEPVWLFDPALIDADFNPTGTVDGHWQDDVGWMGAVWDDYRDEWSTKQVHPTHWMERTHPLAQPAQAGKPQDIGTGDIVRHVPSDEEWLVAFVENGRLCACGWPCSFVPLTDCVLLEKASTATRDKLLQDMENMSGDDPRRSYALSTLAARKATGGTAP